MNKEDKIDPIVQKYFQLIHKNLPHNCQLKWHTNINDQDTKITIYHSHGSFVVDKSELTRLWREIQLNKII